MGTDKGAISERTPFSLEEEVARGGEASVINLVKTLVERAHSLNASDIHIDPTPKGLRVRIRVDGVLQELATCPKALETEIVARIKVLAGLRTDEHRAAQDGRFREILGDGTAIDIRVSIAPTYHGENAVLRLLEDRSDNFTFELLGFSKSDRDKIERALYTSNGMILATGPTGSGKTTTLYTAIKMLNDPEISIVTIEDPIEYAIDGIEQLQVDQRAGLTFANGLRSILRQDPDIIMVGEIRDTETADIAVNTALTGHLLLSTLHTNDAATTLPRLIDMGVDTYLVASTIRLAIGQRLVRTLCEKCTKNVKVTKGMVEALSSLGLTHPLAVGKTMRTGVGCDACNGSGYSGRISINEVLVADQEIQEAIMRRASAGEIKQIAVKNGMTTMLEDGFEKVRKGLTTVEEVLRVIHE